MRQGTSEIEWDSGQVFPFMKKELKNNFFGLEECQGSLYFPKMLAELKWNFPIRN
jgi:hypothetical protein